MTPQIHEEKAIDGVMHWRDREGRWIAYTPEQLTTRLVVCKLNLNNAIRRIEEVSGELRRAS